MPVAAMKARPNYPYLQDVRLRLTPRGARVSGYGITLWAIGKDPLVTAQALLRKLRQEAATGGPL